MEQGFLHLKDKNQNLDFLKKQGLARLHQHYLTTGQIGRNVIYTRVDVGWKRHDFTYEPAQPPAVTSAALSSQSEHEITLSGVVSTPVTVSVDEFTDQFLAWIESNGWSFGGGTGPCVKETEDSQ